MINWMTIETKRAQLVQYENYHTTISPEKHDWFKEEGWSSLPEGEQAVAESQRGILFIYLFTLSFLKQEKGFIKS